MTIQINPLYSYANSGSPLVPSATRTKMIITEAITPSSENSMIFAVITTCRNSTDEITSVLSPPRYTVAMFGDKGMDSVHTNGFYIPSSHGIDTEFFAVRNDSTDARVFDSMVYTEYLQAIYVSLFEVIPTAGKYLHYTDYVRSTLSGSATDVSGDTQVTITPPTQSSGDMIITALTAFNETSVVAQDGSIIHNNLYMNNSGKRMAVGYKSSTGSSSVIFSLTGTNPGTKKYQATSLVIKESSSQLIVKEPHSVNLLRKFDALTTQTSFSGSITLTNTNSMVVGLFSIDNSGEDGTCTISGDISGSAMTKDGEHIYQYVSPSFDMRSAVLSLSGSHATGDFDFSGSIVGASNLAKSRVWLYEIIPPLGFKYTSDTYFSGSWGGGRYNSTVPAFLTVGTSPTMQAGDFILGIRGKAETGLYYRVSGKAERIEESTANSFTVMTFGCAIMEDGDVFTLTTKLLSDSYTAVSYHPEPLPPSADVIWW